MDQTRSHLDLLGIFYYVAAGLTLLCGGAYGGITLLMTGAMSLPARHAQEPVPKEVVWMFGGVGLLVILGALVSALMIALAGWCLRTRRGWVYCVIVAALSLLSVPIGTVLGVFSLIVLVRPEAKALFAGTGAPASGR
jgi:hypothetical protein